MWWSASLAPAQEARPRARLITRQTKLVQRWLRAINHPSSSHDGYAALSAASLFAHPVGDLFRYRPLVAYFASANGQNETAPAPSGEEASWQIRLKKK